MKEIHYRKAVVDESNQRNPNKCSWEFAFGQTISNNLHSWPQLDKLLLLYSAFSFLLSGCFVTFMMPRKWEVTDPGPLT